MSTIRANTITNATGTAGPLLANGYSENIAVLSGTTPALSQANGTIVTWTLSGTSSPTDGMSSGQSITLMITNSGSHAIIWPTMTWVNGAAPTLSTTSVNVFAVWKVNTTLYGKY